MFSLSSLKRFTVWYLPNYSVQEQFDSIYSVYISMHVQE